MTKALPRNDVQMTANSGDIILYQGNSIVFFYGSNSWAYTKLGTIINLTGDKIRDVFSSEDNTVILSLCQ